MVGWMLGTAGALGQEPKMEMREKDENNYSVDNGPH